MPNLTFDLVTRHDLSYEYAKVCTSGGVSVPSIRRAFVQSAQILTVEKSRGRRKALHVTVTRPFGEHVQSCRTLSSTSSSGMQQLLAPAVFLTLGTKE